MHESKKITVVLAASKLTVKRKQRIDRKRKFGNWKNSLSCQVYLPEVALLCERSREANSTWI